MSRPCGSRPAAVRSAGAPPSPARPSSPARPPSPARPSGARPAARSASTSARLRSDAWHTSAHTRRRDGSSSASRIRVRIHSQEAADTPRPGVSVWRTASSRACAGGTPAGAARTASTQRWAPTA
ncbi:hypothetical protein GCM10019016_070080 [Streptomyces prasinosporus]|uniref:Uncharacterized protein n=1 Tax=Streptomyces prasinosporus TaxID=68256 RepID=A0ABP6TZM8_9ACTN